MKVSRRRLASEVVKMLHENPSRKSEILQQVAGFLIANKKVSQADLLMLDVASELEKTEGQLVAEVTSARPLSAASREAIKTKLKTQTGAKSIELNEQLKPELIGGVVIRTPKFELDASVKRQLNQIAAKGVN